MKNAFAALAAATLVLGGCAGGETTRDTGKVTAPNSIGSLDMKLTAAGQTINSALYTITGGPLTTPRSNSVDLTNSSQLRFQVGNLPIANGYSIALTATSTSGVPCSGNAPFNIENNTVTSVSMNLVCSGANVVETDDQGDLRVTVAVQVVDGVVCPVVTGITALPLETAVGSSLQLEGFTSSTSGATVAWTGLGGTFGSASTAATPFTCGAGGDHDLTFAVSKSGCTSSSYAVTVTCTGAVPPADSGVPPVDSGVDSSVPPVDSGVDSSVPPVDSGVDSSVPPVDSGLPPTPCQTCVQASASPCRDWLGSGDFVAGCFNNADPSIVERCVSLYRCAITAADSCAADATGIVKCYCGTLNIDNGACFNTANTPNGACGAEVYAASNCTTQGCVETNLVADGTASFFAQYLTLCTAAPDGCGPSCTFPQPRL